MPRTSRYRKSLQADNGQYWRVDIIPANDPTQTFNYTTAPVVDLGDETVLTISTLKWSFTDDLPFGLAQEPVVDIEFNLETIPSDLKTYLTGIIFPGSNVSYAVRTNIVLIYSSPDNSTWELVYIGVQNPALTQTVTLGYNLESVAKISFQPILPHVLSRCSWTYLNRGFNRIAVPELTLRSTIINHADLQSWTVPGDESGFYPAFSTRMSGDRDTAGTDLYVYMLRLIDCFEAMRLEITLWFKFVTMQDNSQNLTSNLAPQATTWCEWDYQNYYGSDGVIQVRTAQDAMADLSNRLGDEYLALEDIWVPGFISTLNNITKSDFVEQLNDNTTNSYNGCIFGTNSGTSLAGQFKTFGDFFKSLHETTCSKTQTHFTETSGVIKMSIKVFGALEQANNVFDSNIQLLNITASETVDCEIGFTASSVQSGNNRAVNPLLELPAKSPFISSLATQQSFNVKNVLFNWDSIIPDVNPENTTTPSSSAAYGISTLPFNDELHLEMKQTFPFTTLYYYLSELESGVFLKVTEYVIWGDTSAASPREIYYETTGFENNIHDLVAALGYASYLDLYKWLVLRHQTVGTAITTNNLLLKILADGNNWVTSGVEIYNTDQWDLGNPHKLIGAVITDAIPTGYNLPTTGIITNIEFELTTGKYTFTVFHPGMLI